MSKVVISEPQIQKFLHKEKKGQCSIDRINLNFKNFRDFCIGDIIHYYIAKIKKGNFHGVAFGEC